MGVSAALLCASILALALVVVPATAGANSGTRFVSLGDSYTAGNGAEGIAAAGAANDYFDAPCSRHPDAYPFQVVETMPLATLDHLACSGATTADVLNTQIGEIPDPGSVDFYFLTIGGNDVGFESIVATCLIAGAGCNPNLDAAEALLPTVVADTNAILDELTSISPNAEVVLVGYPQLANPQCSTLFPSVASQNRLIDLQEQAEADQVDIAAARSNVSFVSVADAFDGQGPCTPAAGSPLGGGGLVHYLYLVDPFLESFHPNSDGHATIAQEVLALDFSMPQFCEGLLVTVDLALGQLPTADDDVIFGTSGPETINGLAGDDTICGGGGDDILSGGPGDDTILGGPGDDVISGAGGADTLKGGSGVDTINGGAGDDTINGGPDNDDLRGQGGDDTLNGNNGIDTFFGGSGADSINTGEGGNAGTVYVVRGQGGADTIFGSPQDDVLDGGEGQDEIHGGDGNDILNGGRSGDDLFGDEGDDQLFGGPDRDALDGGLGTDDCDGGGHPNDSATATCETIINVP